MEKSNIGLRKLKYSFPKTKIHRLQSVNSDKLPFCLKCPCTLIFSYFKALWANTTGNILVYFSVGDMYNVRAV